MSKLWELAKVGTESRECFARLNVATLTKVLADSRLVYMGGQQPTITVGIIPPDALGYGGAVRVIIGSEYAAELKAAGVRIPTLGFTRKSLSNAAAKE